MYHEVEDMRSRGWPLGLWWDYGCSGYLPTESQNTGADQHM